jgi:hypothetical protein
MTRFVPASLDMTCSPAACLARRSGNLYCRQCLYNNSAQLKKQLCANGRSNLFCCARFKQKLNKGGLFDMNFL